MILVFLTDLFIPKLFIDLLFDPSRSDNTGKTLFLLLLDTSDGFGFCGLFDASETYQSINSCEK